MKIIRVTIALLFAAVTIPVWLAGFLVKLVHSAFTSGQRSYVAFFTWVCR